jgi:hypothetical protein
MVEAEGAKLDVLAVTIGTTVATCTEAPLLKEFVVTLARKFPTAVGGVENVTVSDVAVAAVTVPAAPLLNVTLLFPAVVLNPKPRICTVVALKAKLFTRAVTTGITVATCIADPLLCEFVVTTAVRLPVEGRDVNVTVSVVAVAAVIVPAPPLLKTTRLFASVVSKPKPLIVMLFSPAPRFAVLLVIIGRTVATCTAKLLLTPAVVITAVKLPAFGLVLNVTVSAVAVAAVTVPMAPLLNSTVLLAAVVSKPVPLMVSVVALANKLAVLAVIVGVVTAATTRAT